MIGPDGRHCAQELLKEKFYREGSISVVGVVESVDNRPIHAVEAGVAVWMSGGTTVHDEPRL